MKMPDNLRRVAIVTGAARGIGAAIACRLAGDGMAVAALDLEAGACDATVAAITAGGGQAIAVGADVSQADQVAAAVGTVAADLGPPTVLVNNAGVIRDNLLFKMSEQDWDTVLSVHLRGAFLTSRATQKYMVDQHYGRIINLSSSSALGSRGQVNYAAAKAGLQGFTKTLAVELGPFGITANAVAPGFIATDMTAATAARLTGGRRRSRHLVPGQRGRGLRVRAGDLRSRRSAGLKRGFEDRRGAAHRIRLRRFPREEAKKCCGSPVTRSLRTSQSTVMSPISGCLIDLRSSA
jgi:3-oxoacyl-[acyl-carrier protein] reductase